VKSEPPALQLLSTSTSAVNAGWYYSEKLDGIRVYWDGQRCVTRKKGYMFDVPFKLPAGVPLDGELISSVDGMDMALQIRRKLDHPSWTSVRYMVFDAPGVAGTWLLRQKFLRGILPVDGETDATYAGRPETPAVDGQTDATYAGRPETPAVFLVPQRPLTGPDVFKQLGREVRRIARAGGEGVVLQHPDRLYTPNKRDRTLAVKIKPYYSTIARRVTPTTMRLPDRDEAFTVSKLPPLLEVGGECTVYYQRVTSEGRLVHASCTPPYPTDFHCPSL
jgi:hypothetical protein